MFVSLSIGAVACLMILGKPTSLNRLSTVASLYTITDVKWWQCFRAIIVSECYDLVKARRSKSATRKMARCRTPKANVVHTRKRHIGRPDHYWYKPIPKTSHKSWHYYKKQHELSMSSNLDIIELSITCLDPWSYITKFHTNLLAHSGGNYANPSCKNKVHHPNVFCICTAKPSNKKFIPFVWIFFHLLSLCLCSLHFCAAEQQKCINAESGLLQSYIPFVTSVT